MVRLTNQLAAQQLDAHSNTLTVVGMVQVAQEIHRALDTATNHLAILQHTTQDVAAVI